MKPWPVGTSSLVVKAIADGVVPGILEMETTPESRLMHGQERCTGSSSAGSQSCTPSEQSKKNRYHPEIDCGSSSNT